MRIARILTLDTPSSHMHPHRLLALIPDLIAIGKEEPDQQPNATAVIGEHRPPIRAAPLAVGYGRLRGVWLGGEGAG